MSSQTMQSFWKNGRVALGDVIAASGYRIRAVSAHLGKFQVDWALIKAPMS